jgi:hypothetical protein
MRHVVEGLHLGIERLLADAKGGAPTMHITNSSGRARGAAMAAKS